MTTRVHPLELQDNSFSLHQKDNFSLHQKDYMAITPLWCKGSGGKDKGWGQGVRRCKGCGNFCSRGVKNLTHAGPSVHCYFLVLLSEKDHAVIYHVLTWYPGRAGSSCSNVLPYNPSLKLFFSYLSFASFKIPEPWIAVARFGPGPVPAVFGPAQSR